MQDSLPETPESQPNPPGRPHSALGIASLIVAIVAIIAIFGAFVLAAANTEDVVVGTVFLLGLLLALIGDLLGIIGIFMKQRKKLFPILGTVINTALLVIGIGTLGLGLFFLRTSSSF
ncbi:MAG: hypothetical protein HC910_08460 [Spirulinaceae cyanobacterium SM2_1_0]|nr:hypothetical protein [Spirulinaceae cyanobacterium SM2_1_0]